MDLGERERAAAFAYLASHHSPPQKKKNTTAHTWREPNNPPTHQRTNHSFPPKKTTAFAYLETSGGLALESDYPYEATAGRCRLVGVEAVEGTEVQGYTDVVPGSEAALKAAIAKQPVAIGTHARLRARFVLSLSTSIDCHLTLPLQQTNDNDPDPPGQPSSAILTQPLPPPPLPLKQTNDPSDRGGRARLPALRLGRADGGLRDEPRPRRAGRRLRRGGRHGRRLLVRLLFVSPSFLLLPRLVD